MKSINIFVLYATTVMIDLFFMSMVSDYLSDLQLLVTFVAAVAVAVAIDCAYHMGKLSGMRKQ